MTVELTGKNDADEFKRGGALTTIAASIGLRAWRFPSASKGLFSIIDQAIVSGTSFLTAAIIGRTTSQVEFGQYFILLSIVRIVSAIEAQVVTAPYTVYSKHRRGRELAE
jgi:hypothetical protein